MFGGGDLTLSWYTTAMKNYFGFSGRARRSEFWFFVLFYVIFYVAAAVIGFAIHFTALMLIVGLVHFIPLLAVSWRRLHDTDRSGGWYFINCIPLIGFIIFLVFTCSEGTAGPNKFGPDPKNPGAEAQGGGYQYV